MMFATESIPSKFCTQQGRHYKEFSVTANCHVREFPDSGHFNGLMQMREPKNGYSCSIEMVRLAHTVQDLDMPPLIDVKKAITFRKDLGADQHDLYKGMQTLGVECSEIYDATVELLIARLELGRSIYILSMQDPFSTKKQLREVQSGHYMAACAMDKKRAKNEYVYFADPGFKNGKTRVTKKMLPYLWYDLVMATGEILYRYMIEVPVTAQ